MCVLMKEGELFAVRTLESVLICFVVPSEFVTSEQRKERQTNIDKVCKQRSTTRRTKSTCYVKRIILAALT